MNKKPYFILFVLIFSFFNPDISLGFEKDDIAIYELFLKHFFKINEVRYEFPNYRQILISEKTYLDDSIKNPEDETKKYLRVFFPAISEQMLQDLIEINRKPKQFIQTYFKTIVPEVITEKCKKEIFKGEILEDSWGRFYDKFGRFKGILSLSRISYENNRALMTYGFTCGSKCGGGGIVLMEKASNTWRVMLVFPIWVS